MKLQRTEWMWLDESDTVTLSELSRASGMSVADVDELVEYGALLPLEASRQERVFSAQCVTQLRTACKLRMDFDLDLFSVAMMLGYLNRIEAWRDRFAPWRPIYLLMGPLPYSALRHGMSRTRARRPGINTIRWLLIPVGPVTAIGPAALC